MLYPGRSLRVWGRASAGAGVGWARGCGESYTSIMQPTVCLLHIFPIARFCLYPKFVVSLHSHFFTSLERESPFHMERLTIWRRSTLGNLLTSRFRHETCITFRGFFDCGSSYSRRRFQNVIILYISYIRWGYDKWSFFFVFFFIPLDAQWKLILVLLIKVKQGWGIKV